MDICNGLDEAQPKAAAGRSPTVVDPVETRRHFLQLCIGNARSRVFDDQSRACHIAHGRNGDLAALFRIFQRVVDQVNQCLEDKVPVAID